MSVKSKEGSGRKNNAELNSILLNFCQFKTSMKTLQGCTTDEWINSAHQPHVSHLWILRGCAIFWNTLLCWIMQRYLQSNRPQTETQQNQILTWEEIPWLIEVKHQLFNNKSQVWLKQCKHRDYPISVNLRHQWKLCKVVQPTNDSTQCISWMYHIFEFLEVVQSSETLCFAE